MRTAGSRGAYLGVSAHDLARFLVESLAVPLGVLPFKRPSQAVVLAQEERVD